MPPKRSRSSSAARPVEDRVGLARLDRGNASGRATREAIVRTAERLFAERGLEGVSLREIGVAAGQRNNFAAQYHFGDRESLIRAIYEFRTIALNQARLAALDRLDAGGQGGDPAALLRALLEPHAAHMSDPDSSFLGFLMQVRSNRGSFATYDTSQEVRFMEGYYRIQERLRRCFPALSDEAFARRFDLVFGWAVQAMATYERTVTGHGPFIMPASLVLDEVVEMLVGALGAGTERASQVALRSVKPAPGVELHAGSGRP